MWPTQNWQNLNSNTYSFPSGFQIPPRTGSCPLAGSVCDWNDLKPALLSAHLPAQVPDEIKLWASATCKGILSSTTAEETIH